MTLSDVANIATIVQGVVVIVSLIFIVVQLKLTRYELQQNVNLTKAANVQHLAELSLPFKLQLIQDRQVAKLWVHGAKKWDAMDEVDQLRYHYLVGLWLLIHENIYIQKENRLLDEKAYEPWDKELRKFVVEQDIKRHWRDSIDTWGNFYQEKFAKHIDTI